MNASVLSAKEAPPHDPVGAFCSNNHVALRGSGAGPLAGLTMAVVTLGVIAWATPVYGEAVARTMGLTVFSLANIWFAFETAHEEKSIVSAETLANPTLLKTGALAIIARRSLTSPCGTLRPRSSQTFIGKAHAALRPRKPPHSSAA